MPKPRWAELPSGIRAMIFAAVAVFAYGTVAHVLPLTERGFDAYPTLPSWLAAYSISLTLFDPLAAALLLLRRRSGLVLGCAVLVTSATGLAYSAYVIDTTPGVTVARIGQAVVTLLAAALLVAAPRIWPWLGR